jgi:hypothetical protein
MFCIDLWGFSINQPYFGYNSAEHETPVLRIFTFQGPFKTQTKRGFFRSQYFSQSNNLR